MWDLGTCAEGGAGYQASGRETGSVGLYSGGGELEILAKE